MCVLTDLVCSGRGAITGGGSASSSSSSSETVAMAGVSDTAFELCVTSQGERGRSLSDIIVTWANSDTRPIIASYCHFLYCFIFSSCRVLLPVFSSSSLPVSPLNLTSFLSRFLLCLSSLFSLPPLALLSSSLLLSESSGHVWLLMPLVTHPPLHPSLLLSSISLTVWSSAGGQAAETGRRWKEEKMLIHNADRERERKRKRRASLGVASSSLPPPSSSLFSPL